MDSYDTCMVCSRLFCRNQPCRRLLPDRLSNYQSVCIRVVLLCIPSCKHLLHLILLCCRIACCIRYIKIKISIVQTSALIQSAGSRCNAGRQKLPVVVLKSLQLDGISKPMAETMKANFDQRLECMKRIAEI